jgi:hypothetical protein
MAAKATFALKPGLCVRRVRFVMLAPDTRQHRRCQAGKPVIDLSEFLEPLLAASRPSRTVYRRLIDALSSVTGSQERRAQHVALFVGAVAQ